MAIAIYDYCLTIAPEVELIWGRRWNVIRVTFTLTRYVTFIGAAMTTYAAVADRSGFKSVRLDSLFGEINLSDCFSV
ncbi:hypothetical protein M405DRAFT_865893 [Rhizopogon salebrosus TDB-379]|nr:hypothetical protein M405DRAFT_865893 [Rhizopogon salebrosus TDB-379]